MAIDMGKRVIKVIKKPTRRWRPKNPIFSEEGVKQAFYHTDTALLQIYTSRFTPGQTQP